MAAASVIARGGWAELALNRPAQRNAINGDLAEALADGLQRLNEDRSMRAILLRGADGALCSGLDIKAFNADPRPEWLPRFGAMRRAAHKALYFSGCGGIEAREQGARMPQRLQKRCCEAQRGVGSGMDRAGGEAAAALRASPEGDGRSRLCPAGRASFERRSGAAGAIKCPWRARLWALGKLGDVQQR